MLEKHLKRITMLLTCITLGMFTFIMMGSRQIESAPVQDAVKFRNIRSPFDNKIYPVRIPDTSSFAGETVPLKDADVRERFDRELMVNTYWHSQTLYTLKEFNKMVSIIEPILKRYNVPHDFVFLCVAESGLQYNAVSPSGATGLWQFLEETGKGYGLEINGEVDERYHFEKATEAACKYLLEAKEKFGNWTLAAASYNMGMNGMEDILQRQQVASYYDLYTNRETARYIYRILALKEVLQHPVEYGFFIGEEDRYAKFSYYTVSIDSSVSNWVTFAKDHGTNYKTLKLLNPWIINYTLTNRMQKTYEVKLPKAEE